MKCSLLISCSYTEEKGFGCTGWLVGYITINTSLLTFLSFPGPISSAFVNKYGCRNVTIAGAILGASCLAVSVFAKNVLTLCITIGFGTGKSNQSASTSRKSTLLKISSL